MAINTSMTGTRTKSRNLVRRLFIFTTPNRSIPKASSSVRIFLPPKWFAWPYLPSNLGEGDKRPSQKGLLKER
jgi:hypothetical protein